MKGPTAVTHQQPDYVDATFYAVVEPIWGRRRDSSGRPVLDGAKVERITKNRPQQIRGDAVVTRLTVRVDAAALLPLQPEAVIHITPTDVDVIHVAAQHPDGEDA
ncbi:hypothetical protein [Nocardioides sp.]|uniref:hypothetical protein n=1 Tax=Nocardioides sp. TaxID=35761 RepID=UPI002608878E|nr:hypothetical protein [Nocardioides sp.]MDI6911464.1 hypothetical protein [Nocardioides sp.]